MNAIAKGCLQSLIVWAAGSGALYPFFKGRFEAPADDYAILAGGFLISCAYGTVINALLALKQRRVIAAARTGAAPQDGKLLAAIGPIQALKEPLLSPFRRKPCVAYGYGIERERVRHSSRNGTTRTKQTFMGGFAMTPCAVRTPIASIRILGFAMPNSFPEDRFPAVQYREQIVEHSVAVRDKTTGSSNPVKILQQLKNALTEDDGDLQEHWITKGFADEMEDLPEETVCMEQLIPDRAPVCVIGVWSAAKGGLLGDLSQGGLQVFPGDASAALGQLRGTIIGNLVFGVILLLLGVFGTWGISSLYTRSTEVMARRLVRLTDAVEADDLVSARRELALGIDFNKDQSQVEKLAEEMKSEEMIALLVKNGFDLDGRRDGGRTTLDNALHRGDLDRVRMLIRAGARADSGVSEFGTTALERAFDSGNQQLFEIIRETGGKGVYVTAENGKSIDPNGPAMMVIHQYLKAYATDDTAGVRALVDNWPESFFESFERGVYKGTRPQTCTLVKGYENDSAATALLQYPQRGYSEYWVVTVVKRGDQWKVLRESWDSESRFPTFF